MKKLILLAAVLVATVALGTTISAAPIDLNVNNMEIKWSDEFDGTELNRSYWTPQIGNGSAYGIAGWGNNEKQNYKEDNISVSNGTMKITAKYEPTTYMGNNYNWTSARITSNQLVHVGLGYVEARIKIPSSQGIWPAFWMLGTNGKTWPANGEIDIMEAFNTRPTLQSTIHYPNWSGKDVYTFSYTDKYDKTQWHTFGCYRDGKVIAFYIDRVLLHEFSTEDLATGAMAGKRSVLNDDYYILFNIACGGNLAGGVPPYNPEWKAVMEVDYVRYYKEKPAQNIQPTTKKDVPITKITKPVRVKITQAKNVKKKKINIKFKKIKGVKGYQVRWCDNKKFNGYEEKRTSKTKYTLKGLEKKATYFIKVRAYKVSNGRKLYGAWSKVKRVKIKK
jgi:beta-glucanase (GH16 family)